MQTLVQLVLEAQEAQNQENLSIQILRKKLQAVNNYIESLLQKKIRLDLEIKRQKKVLSKLKKRTQTELKFSVNLESTQTQNVLERLLQQGNPQYIEELQEFSKEFDRATSLLMEIQTLEEAGQMAQ